MARLVAFTFDTDEASPNDGKISVSMDNTDAPGTPYDFYIGITAPSGEVLKALPTVTPDAALNGGTSDSFEVDIPLDSDGNYLGGTYTFVVRRDDGASDDTTVTKTFVYTPHNDPDHLAGTPTLDVDFQCLDGAILAQDTTDYEASGLTIVEREITITPPSIDPQSAATGAGPSETLTVAFTNVTYGVELNVRFERDEEDLGDDVGVECVYSVILYEEVDVECETGGICGSLECLGEELDKVYNQACAAGGYTNLSATIKDKMVWAMMNITMAKMKYDCGKVTESQTYLARAKEAINCGCGCNDTGTDTDPQPYTPPAA